MGSSVVSPEKVLESLMNDGTVDAIRLKIINQLKTNEELRNNTITMVEESRVLSTPGAEKQTKRELFEALRAELETQALEMASKAVWELILDNNGLGKEINETVEEVFCRLNGCKAPPFPTHPPQHQQPMPPPPPPLQPPQQQPPQQQPQPPTLLQQFSKQQQPPLPQLLQQLLQQQQHGALPSPFQPPAQLQHPPLAPLPQLPLQHFPQQHTPLPTQLQHPPLAPLPQLPLQRLPQQQQLPQPLHQLPQQQYPQLPPQPPLPPQLQEQPPPPPPSPPPPQPPPPSPPSPMQQPPPPSSMQQPSPQPQQHLFPSLQFLTADVQIENDKDSEEREEGEKVDGEKVDDIEMTESSSPKRAFSELNMQGAALVSNADYYVFLFSIYFLHLIGPGFNGAGSTVAGDRSGGISLSHYY